MIRVLLLTYKIVDNFSAPFAQNQPPTVRYFSKNSAFNIRSAQLRDVDGMTAILADSFHSRGRWCGFTYNLFKMGIYEDLRLRLRTVEQYSVCLVAIYSHPNHQESIAGTVEMTRRYHPSGEKYVYIANLAVNHIYRRQGVAQNLLLRCEQTALEWGFKDVYLHVMENNHPARKLYRHLGYRLHEIVPSWRSYLLKQPRKFFLHKQLNYKHLN